MGESFQKIERYWEPDFSTKRRFGQEELLEELDNVFRDSVKRHLVSDVPFGALLSGGVDSSLVVGYMSEILNRPVKTFSIGFEDENVDELQYARIVAKKYGTEHHEEIVRFDALEMLPEIVKHHGEPFGDQSAIPTWAVSRLARSEVPMVLSGDGGDELFAGYHWYGSWLNRVSNCSTFQKLPWKSQLKRAAKSFLFNQRPVPIGKEGQVVNWLDQITRFHPCQRERLWNRDLRFLSDQESQSLNRSFAEAASATGVNRVQRVDLETYLPENILRKVDIASMRYGLEVRPPILDLRFFKAASSIPSAMLYTAGETGSAFCGKMPLKRLAAQKLGDDFAFRTKQGFVLPLQAWLRSNSDHLQVVEERLLHTRANIRNWFDEAEIRKVVASGSPENVWLLLALEEWCQQFASRNSPGELIHA